MTTERAHQPDHLHFFNYHTGRPRFHFDEAGDAAAASAAAAAAAASAKPWHDGTDPEILGHWQNKGFDLADPAKIAIEMTKQHRAAEKHFGVPVDRLIKLPAVDAKPEEWAAVHQKLGAPLKPEEYDFSTVKNAAGEAIPASLADALRAAAFTKGVNKEAATTLAQAVVRQLDADAASSKLVTDGKLAAEKAALATNWGGQDSAKFNFNHLQAMEGARKAGITPEAVKAMEGQVGYASVMEHFRKLGSGMSEATFHEGGGNGSGVSTRDGAVARLAELEADKAWGKRLGAGDAVATAEWRQLTALISGEAA